MIHNHDYWWRFFPKKELTQVYISAAIRYFAVSLIGIFVPLYLYKEMGYSLSATLSFFIFYSVVFAISTPVAAKFAAYYGAKHSVLLGVPLYLIFVALLYLLPTYRVNLLIVGTFLGLSQAFYWMGMHLVFHHASDHKHRGEEVGKRSAVSIGATIFGPLFGGIVIVYAGFGAVFISAGLLLLVSVLCLFRSTEEHIPYHFSIRSVVNKRYWRDSLFFVSRGAFTISNGVIWPMFIFVILGNYFSLGVVGSLLSGVSALLMWVGGKFSDKVNKRTIIRWLVPFETVAWVARALVTTVGHVYGAAIFGALSHGALESPLGALEYDKARSDIAGYFVSRETFLCLGRVLALTFVLMTDSLMGGLVFQGIASFAALLF